MFEGGWERKKAMKIKKKEERGNPKTTYLSPRSPTKAPPHTTPSPVKKPQICHRHLRPKHRRTQLPLLSKPIATTTVSPPSKQQPPLPRHSIDAPHLPPSLSHDDSLFISLPCILKRKKSPWTKMI